MANYILSDDSVYFKKKYHLYESNSRDEEKIKVFCKQYFVPFTNETYDFAQIFLKSISYYDDCDSLDRPFWIFNYGKELSLHKKNGRITIKFSD